MAIYFFELMVGFFPNGVDNSQGYRAQLLKDSEEYMRFIFTNFPDYGAYRYYEQMGIDGAMMESMHMRFAGRREISFSTLAESLVESLTDENVVECVEEDAFIVIRYNNGIKAKIELCDDRKFAHRVHYYADGILYRYDYYTDSLIRSVFVKDGAQHIRYYNRDGSWAYDERGFGEGVRYSFADGTILNHRQMIDKYIQKLELSSNDVVVMDRPGHRPFFYSLLKYKNDAKLIGFVHSIHYGSVVENVDERTWYYEYYNWIKNLEMIDTLIVSTEQQKQELILQIAKVSDYIPRVEVIPAGGLEKLVKPSKPRKPFSLVTASRLEDRKKINIIIRAAIMAHNIEPRLTLDIYGEGSMEQHYKNLVSEYEADDYIRFMGYETDVISKLADYEVFVTASLWETLGLSMMEAVGAGNAMVALDVRYGSRLFTRNGINGRLVDFSLDRLEEDVARDMAKIIVEMIEDREGMKKYEAHSYEVASEFLREPMRQKWYKVLGL